MRSHLKGLFIWVLEKGDYKQKKDLLKILGNKNASLGDINRAIKIIKNSGALSYAGRIAKRNITDSKKYLKKARLNGEGFDFFNKFADYIIRRKE